MGRGFGVLDKILINEDKQEEACGIFAVYAPGEDVSRLTYFGLHGLQHRGQESAGIAVADGSSIFVYKDLGLVPQVFTESNLNSLSGHIAIGHVRYSTTGSTRWENAQPIHKAFSTGTLALAHNGNLVNTRQLRESLIERGNKLTTTSDSEVMASLVAEKADHDITSAIKESMQQFKGAYSVVIMTEDKLFAFRGPCGIRPLSLGRRNGHYVIASETCALDLVGADYLRDVKAGELIQIDENGLQSFNVVKDSKPSLCIFEFIYFARPDSVLYNTNLYHARKNMGLYLAEEAPVQADIVIPIPDSGTPAAVGFAERSKIPFGEGLIKNRYIGRTFIQPSQSIRELGIKLKLNPLKEMINGKRVVLVDDSIVRGNTSKKIVSLIREAGAKEVHMRISSPPVKYPCFYGIDTATSAELIASDKTIEEIKDFIQADSVAYLSIDSLVKSTGNQANKFCMACFDKRYPIEIAQDLRLSKFMLEETKV